jgi:hypothetical protein
MAGGADESRVSFLARPRNHAAGQDRSHSKMGWTVSRSPLPTFGAALSQVLE